MCLAATIPEIYVKHGTEICYKYVAGNVTIHMIAICLNFNKSMMTC